MESAKNTIDLIYLNDKKDKSQPCSGVPFRAVKREQCTYTLQDFDSPLWEVYRGAYGNVKDYLVILMGERESAPETFKLRRMENIPKTNYEMAFDNLCENLWHQMTFYSATWLVLPYLARLMEGWEKEGDEEWLFQGIVAVGSCLATDVYGDKPREDDVQESYKCAVLQIRAITINFLAGHIDYAKKKDILYRREFAIAVMAILGEKKLAFIFFMTGMESCYFVCPGCEDCDDEIEFDCLEPSEQIERAEIPAEQWDGESLENVKLWLFNLFHLLGDMEGIQCLCFYFGTYICPDCGKRVSVLTGMEEYLLP